jgi:RNA polymerase sigma factor (sigma-70 family)
MLTEEQAQDLMNKLVDLRNQVKNSNDPKIKKELHKHERKCINDFKYLITMKTGRYKAFSNYEDLNQEGLEALLKAMKTYNPQKGSFFSWAHHYIGTRISRSANLHTTIRYPLKVAKEHTPHKESVMPVIIEDKYCPDKELENHEMQFTMSNAIDKLNPQQKEIISLAYGFESDKPMSINKICRKLGISRLNCVKIINNALSSMKDELK